MDDVKTTFYKTLNIIVGTNRVDNEEAYIINNYISRLEATIKDEQKEIERLNNIIDELEKYINEEIEDYNEALNSKLLSESGKEKYEAEKVCFLDMLDKLNELKGDNK